MPESERANQHNSGVGPTTIQIPRSKADIAGQRLCARNVVTISLTAPPRPDHKEAFRFISSGHYLHIHIAVLTHAVTMR